MCNLRFGSKIIRDKENMVPECHLYTLNHLKSFFSSWKHTLFFCPTHANCFVLVTLMLVPQSEMASGFSQVLWEITFPICQAGTDSKQRFHFYTTSLAACAERLFSAPCPIPIISEFPREGRNLQSGFFVSSHWEMIPQVLGANGWGKAHKMVDMD